MSELPGWTLVYAGKVRDLYVSDGQTLPTATELLMVASDRVSAFDFALEPAIPGKGAALTRMSNWWFDELALPSQLAEDAAARTPREVADRALLVRKLEMVPIECVVRGRLTGSGLAEYRQSGTVTGIPLPPGLEDGDALPAPIFTPAWKAPKGQHDENISFERCVELVGAPTAEELRSRSIATFLAAARVAATRGLVLADTKFEFGREPETGELLFADEVLTADSSRYWDAEALEAGRIESFDKQIVRNWLAANWDGTGTPPRLPDEIVAQTSARYRELIVRLAS